MMNEKNFHDDYGQVLKSVISGVKESNVYGICGYKNKEGAYIHLIDTLILERGGNSKQPFNFDDYRGDMNSLKSALIEFFPKGTKKSYMDAILIDEADAVEITKEITDPLGRSIEDELNSDLLIGNVKKISVYQWGFSKKANVEIDIAPASFPIIAAFDEKNQVLQIFFNSQPLL